MSDTPRTTQPDSPAKGLFLGEIRMEQLSPFPKIGEAERETLALVIESIDRFMADKGEDFRAYDVRGEQPAEYIEQLKELGLF